MAEATEVREMIARDSARCQALLAEVERVVVGQRTLVEHMLLGALCEGHVLLEGVPGLGKTLAARTFAAAIRGSFTRIQFTPDLLPGDLTGTEVFDPDGRRFVPRLGPVVTNILLADEINRAPAKVQAALLEAMEERQVTVGGQTFPLPRPFLVLATQNPIEQEGTYPLPEAQVDRFLFKVLVDYPGHADELAVVDAHLDGELPAVRPVLEAAEICEVAAGARAVHVDERIREYAVRLTRATRDGGRGGGGTLAAWVRYGASPRAAIALAKASQALALVRGRSYVIPEDVKEVAPAVLRHRLILSLEAQAEQVDVEHLVHELLLAVELP
ncbi:MAG TPA: AAA family ATPase [Thermoanaerobaculaceae bacterium]|nr:AAA family ATPase [Thermoanaerobaculaceae bacterium]